MNIVIRLHIRRFWMQPKRRAVLEMLSLRLTSGIALLSLVCDLGQNFQGIRRILKICRGDVFMKRMSFSRFTSLYVVRPLPCICWILTVNICLLI